MLINDSFQISRSLIYHPLTTFLVFSNSLKSTEKGEVSKLILNSGSEVTNAPTIARLLARNSKTLYSDDLLTSSEIDHFIRLGLESTDLAELTQSGRSDDP